MLVVEDRGVADEAIVVARVVAVGVDHLDDALTAFEDEQLVGVAHGDEEATLPDAVHVVDVEPVRLGPVVGRLVARVGVPLPRHLAVLDDQHPLVFHVREDEPATGEGFDVVDLAGDAVADGERPLVGRRRRGIGVGVDDPEAGAVTPRRVGAAVLVAVGHVGREDGAVVEFRHIEVDGCGGLPPLLFVAVEEANGAVVVVAADPLYPDEGPRRVAGRGGARHARRRERRTHDGRRDEAETPEDDEDVTSAEPGGHRCPVVELRA